MRLYIEILNLLPILILYVILGLRTIPQFIFIIHSLTKLDNIGWIDVLLVR
mgnify:CR=1 FL=1